MGYQKKQRTPEEFWIHLEAFLISARLFKGWHLLVDESSVLIKQGQVCDYCPNFKNCPNLFFSVLLQRFCCRRLWLGMFGWKEGIWLNCWVFFVQSNFLWLNFSTLFFMYFNKLLLDQHPISMVLYTGKFSRYISMVYTDLIKCVTNYYNLKPKLYSHITVADAWREYFIWMFLPGGGIHWQKMCWLLSLH